MINTIDAYNLGKNVIFATVIIESSYLDKWTSCQTDDMINA